VRPLSPLVQSQSVAEHDTLTARLSDIDSKAYLYRLAVHIPFPMPVEVKTSQWPCKTALIWYVLMGPKVGGPEIVAAHGCQNMDGPRPAQPNRFHHLGLQCGALVPQEDNNYCRMLHFISKIIDNIGSSSCICKWKPGCGRSPVSVLCVKFY